MSRDTLLSPYRAETERSMERRAANGIRPKGLGGLLTWFLAEWSLEIPSRLHGQGVFFGRPETRSLWARETKPADLAGGSLIGAPAIAEPFRRYIENHAQELDQDGFYARPMHAALHRMAGRGHTEREYMALFLAAVAMAAGDWEAVCVRSLIPLQVGRVYVESSLNRLFDLWRSAPDTASREVAA